MEVKSEFQQKPTVLLNEVIELKNTSSNADTYMWSFGNGVSSMDTDPHVSYSTEGNYTITLIASKGSCSDTLKNAISVLNPVELGVTSSNTEVVEVYTSNGTLVIRNPANNGKQLTMYSQLGQIVLFGNIGEKETKLDLPELPTGLYTVNVQDAQGMVLKSERLFISADR